MTERPMFPLGTALLPGGVLPLHVFEPSLEEIFYRLTLGADALETGTVESPTEEEAA